MKAFVTALALTAALLVATFVIAVQLDRFSFTSRDGQITQEPLDWTPRVVPVAMAVAIEEPEPAVNPVITLDEIDIVARPTPRRAKQAPRDYAAPKVIAAPCVDGEYRKIDEQRGVTLTCPGKD